MKFFWRPRVGVLGGWHRVYIEMFMCYFLFLRFPVPLFIAGASFGANNRWPGKSAENCQGLLSHILERKQPEDLFWEMSVHNNQRKNPVASLALRGKAFICVF